MTGSEGTYLSPAPHGGGSTVALLTARNRRDKTIACLQTLQDVQEIHAIILVDDDSSDGTAEAAEAFTKARVVMGSGSDYWAGGMRRAWDWAVRSFPAADLLLVNDDIVTTPSDIDRFVKLSRRCPRDLFIVGGAFRGSQDGPVVYGGSVRSQGRRAAFHRVSPSSEFQRVHVLNANLLYVPRRTRDLIGGLSPLYRHGFADFEYSLRVNKAGGEVLLAPGTYGVCTPNSISGTHFDAAMPVGKRLASLLSPKGLPPREWIGFCMAAGGILWPGEAVGPYVKFAMSIARQAMGEGLARLARGRCGR